MLSHSMTRVYINFCSGDDLLVLPHVDKRIANAIITICNDVGNLWPEDFEFIADIIFVIGRCSKTF